jgi:hypothetical protein
VLQIRKFAIIISISTGILIVLLFIALGYFFYRLHHIEKETYEYLLENHEPDEIQEVKGTLGFGHLFVATVIFEDEQDVIYEYIEKDGKIIQLTPEPGTGDYKNSE